MHSHAVERRKKVVRWTVILVIAAAHFAASFVALLFSFGASMSRFDSPSPAPYSALETFMDRLTDVLFFPAVPLWPTPAPGILGHLLIALNSLLWAVCIYTAVRFVVLRVRRHENAA